MGKVHLHLNPFTGENYEQRPSNAKLLEDMQLRGFTKGSMSDIPVDSLAFPRILSHGG
jgi:hypothetical protein